MKLLINNKELAHFFLSTRVYVPRLMQFKPEDNNTAVHVQNFISKKSKWSDPNRVLNDDEKRKFKDKLFRNVELDLREWVSHVKDQLQRMREEDFHMVHNNIDYIVDKIGASKVLSAYRKSKKQEFVKSTGLTISKTAPMIRRHEFNSYTEDCLIRNTVGNEELLVTKINNNYPMWFIDSGYTNFLENNKKWHRIVRNHLHYGKFFEAPSDRLSNFPKFPKPWRSGGEIIYVIEPGPFAAQVFNVNLKTWKYDVARELRKYTDKPIVFRKKAPKRNRPSLIKQLQNEDYYCVVSLNSNAATEAIWEGIPAMTLGTHISNPVAVQYPSQINDLYKGSLNNWLAMLSYSQFTKEELMNGTAVKMLRKYQNAV